MDDNTQEKRPPFQMSDTDKLTCLLNGIVRDIDAGCWNLSVNCYSCKYNSKCKVMFVKEAFCMAHGLTKTMSNDKWKELRAKYWIVP